MGGAAGEVQGGFEGMKGNGGDGNIFGDEGQWRERGGGCVGCRATGGLVGARSRIRKPILFACRHHKH